MTQQEAYVKLKSMLDEIKQLVDEHDLVLELRDRGELPETLDPDLYDVIHKSWRGRDGVDHPYTSKVFKKEMNAEQLNKMMKIFNCDLEEVKDYLDQNIDESWIPSQLC